MCYNKHIAKRIKKMTEFKSWEEMTVLEQMQCQFWDMYKDAYGVRPRGIDTSAWTEDDFEDEFLQLGEHIRQAEDDRVAMEMASVKRFEARVAQVIECGAADRETALRWIMEGSDCSGDWEYFSYCNGLPYRYFNKVNENV
jgi:hypothetical protein